MSEGLDRATSLAPGHRRLNLSATADVRFLCGVVDYAHRISPRVVGVRGGLSHPR